jgi:hypothetical protein
MTIKNFLQFNENKNFMTVGGYSLTKKKYDSLYDDNLGATEEELLDYLNIIENYQNNGGEIQRIIFSNKRPDIKNPGYSWTHIGNHWSNYIYSIFDFNYEEGYIKGDEGVWLLTASTPPGNIAVEASLEQFQNNPEEQELRIVNTGIIKITDIKKVK